MPNRRGAYDWSKLVTDTMKLVLNTVQIFEVGKTNGILLGQVSGDSVVSAGALSRRAYAQYYLIDTGRSERTRSSIRATPVAQSLRTVLFERHQSRSADAQ